MIRRALGWIMIFSLLSLTVGIFAQRGDSPFATQDPLAKALAAADVYVGKTLRDQISESDLQQIVNKAPKDRPLKIVVVKQLPDSGKSYKNRDNYTKALHQYLGLGNGMLFVMNRNGISVSTDSLTGTEIQKRMKPLIGTLQSNPIAGIEKLAECCEAVFVRRVRFAALQASAVPKGGHRLRRGDTQQNLVSHSNRSTRRS